MTSFAKALGDDHEAPLLVIPLWHVAFDHARTLARRATSAPPWPRVVFAQLVGDAPLPPSTLQQLQSARITVVRLPAAFAGCPEDDPVIQAFVRSLLKGRAPTPPSAATGQSPGGVTAAPGDAGSKRPPPAVDIETVDDP